jgi:hypothetical protein
MKALGALLLTLGCIGFTGSAAVASVHASHGSSSHPTSFKSGFSSQHHTSAAKPVAPASGNSSFGAFGAGKSNTAASQGAPAAGSALSKDLGNSAAKADALKTYDARTAAARAAAAPPAAPGQPAANGYGSQGGAAAQPGYVPQTVIVQNSGSSHPFLWFMLGRAMSPHEHTTYINSGNGGANNGATNGSPANASNSADGNATPAAVQPETSTGMHLLRLVLWLGMIGGLIALARWIWLRRAASSANTSHYSLGKV